MTFSRNMEWFINHDDGLPDMPDPNADRRLPPGGWYTAVFQQSEQRGLLWGFQAGKRDGSAYNSREPWYDTEKEARDAAIDEAWRLYEQETTCDAQSASPASPPASPATGPASPRTTANGPSATTATAPEPKAGRRSAGIAGRRHRRRANNRPTQ